MESGSIDLSIRIMTDTTNAALIPISLCTFLMCRHFAFITIKSKCLFVIEFSFMNYRKVIRPVASYKRVIQITNTIHGICPVWVN